MLVWICKSSKESCGTSETNRRIGAEAFVGEYPLRQIYSPTKAYAPIHLLVYKLYNEHLSLHLLFNPILWTFLDIYKYDHQVLVIWERYTYCMLSETGTYYEALTWLNYTLWIPVYPLSILAKAFAIYESLPYFESFGTYSTKLPFPVALSICFPYILKMYLAMLFVVTLGQVQSHSQAAQLYRNCPYLCYHGYAAIYA
ncbi:3-hydroxyacyl-CoA dehydratase 4 [Chelonia mydas]|uniref:Very-long-chain (3R)-3-hydroxyacyl-CoA dehydratase n=1 Tax=Chelonia mydas TaxID=8469 RepID=M7BA48_CHEMY|nr:3-hydroxyacyl-CoA dehydratase 4 [Chelonia mydas]